MVSSSDISLNSSNFLSFFSYLQFFSLLHFSLFSEPEYIAQPFPSFPLIGPRNFFETESSLKALSIDLSDKEIDWLDLKDN